MQREFDICKSINIINYTNGFKDKDYMISIDAEKFFNKIQHAFMSKVLENV